MYIYLPQIPPNSGFTPLDFFLFPSRSLYHYVDRTPLWTDAFQCFIPFLCHSILLLLSGHRAVRVLKDIYFGEAFWSTKGLILQCWGDFKKNDVLFILFDFYIKLLTTKFPVRKRSLLFVLYCTMRDHFRKGSQTERDNQRQGTRTAPNVKHSWCTVDLKDVTLFLYLCESRQKFLKMNKLL